MKKVCPFWFLLCAIWDYGGTGLPDARIGVSVSDVALIKQIAFLSVAGFVGLAGVGTTIVVVRLLYSVVMDTVRSKTSKG